MKHSSPSLKSLLLLCIVFAVGAATAVVLAEPVVSILTRAKSKARRTWVNLSGDKDSRPEAEWSPTPGFKQSVHARGFNYPTRIVLHPNPGPSPTDPLYYVAELGGAIKVVSANGSVSSVIGGLLNFRREPMDELGLMGLDIDRTARNLFISLAYWDAAGGVYRNRVDRLSLSADGRSAGDRRVLLDMVNESTVASYQIQFTAMAPDGSLYVGVGSGGNKSDAQHPDRFAGKILRMNAEGKALPDNPFYDPAHPGSPRSYTYARGFRNPFDIEWDPDSGTAIVSDVGPGVDRIVRLERGLNYCFGGGPEGDTQMRANALFTWGPGGSFAPTGVAIVPPSPAKPGSRKRLLLGLFGAVHMPGVNQGKRVLEFDLQPTGHVDSAPRIAVQYTGEYFSSVSDVETAKDGSVYFADVYGKGDLPHDGKGLVYRLVGAGAAPGPGTQLPALAASASGPELFAALGCVACHDLEPGAVKKEGPPLAGLKRALDERLNSAAYDALLAELSSRSGAYFEGNRPVYSRLRETRGDARIQAWFELRLADPRFDNPSAKMPSFVHLSKQHVNALRSYLLN